MTAQGNPGICYTLMTKAIIRGDFAAYRNAYVRVRDAAYELEVAIQRQNMGTLLLSPWPVQRKSKSR